MPPALKTRQAHWLMQASLATTLTFASLAVSHAETLYRWTEADGSTTYAPEPPAKGIAYEAVGPASTDGRKAQSNRLPSNSITSTVPRGPTTPVAPEAAAGGTAIRLPTSKPGAVTPVSGRAAGDTIRPAPQGPAAALAEPAPAAPDTDGQRSTRTQKSRHCDDLGKRITSLERRLRADISAEDMDNTVVNMARYQRNLDRFCR